MNATVKRIILFNKTLHSCGHQRGCIAYIRSISYSYIAQGDSKLTDSNKENPKVRQSDSENEDHTHTWVGPPDPVSNLRPKVFPSSKHLTKEEVHLYEKSKEIQEWNQEYWVSHNKDFEHSKRSYIEKKANEKNADSNINLNSEEMADFYKEFLNKNYKKHLSYNWEWYKKNFELIYLSAKAQVSKLRKLVK